MALYRLIFVANRPANNPVNGWQRGDLSNIIPGRVAMPIRQHKPAWIAAGHAAADWPGTFVTVNVELTKAQLQTIKDLLYPGTGSISVIGTKIPEAQQRVRRRHLDIDDVLAALPTAKRQKLRDDGEITVSWDSVKSFVKTKVI